MKIDKNLYFIYSKKFLYKKRTSYEKLIRFCFFIKLIGIKIF